MLMENLYGKVKNQNKLLAFDLKGSSVNRYVKINRINQKEYFPSDLSELMGSGDSSQDLENF
jgi:hypothetical protein